MIFEKINNSTKWWTEIDGKLQYNIHFKIRSSVYVQLLNCVDLKTEIKTQNENIGCIIRVLVNIHKPTNTENNNNI